MATYLSGTYTSTYTLTVSPTTVTSTGIVDVNSSVSGAAGVYGPSATGWTLANLGTIESIGSLGIGVGLPFGGLVINGQSGSTAGFIYGSAFGVLIGSPGIIGTVINFGTLQGGVHGIRIGAGSINNSGFISGTTEVFTSGTVINSGTAAGDVTLARGFGTVKNSGVILGQVTIYSGLVANYQSIVSAPGTSKTAIFFLGGGPGTVNNFGTIEGFGGASGITFAYGVIGAVTNSGTISSTTTAVDFSRFGSAVIGNSGLISGDTTGVSSGETTTVGNVGVIESIGSQGVGVDLAASGTVNNAGLISGVSIGVRVGTTGIVVNAGTITASGTSGNAISFGGTTIATGTVINQGMIIETASGTSSNNVGIFLNSGGLGKH